jgi:hypothetical protein
MSLRSQRSALFRFLSLARVDVVGGQCKENGLSFVHHWQPVIVAGVVATNNAATTRAATNA